MGKCLEAQKQVLTDVQCKHERRSEAQRQEKGLWRWRTGCVRGLGMASRTMASRTTATLNRGRDGPTQENKGPQMAPSSRERPALGRRHCRQSRALCPCRAMNESAERRVGGRRSSGEGGIHDLGVLSSPRDWGTPRESPRDWGHLQEVEGARVMAAAGSVSLLVEMSVNTRCLTLLEPSEANGWSSL